LKFCGKSAAATQKFTEKGLLTFINKIDNLNSRCSQENGKFLLSMDFIFFKQRFQLEFSRKIQLSMPEFNHRYGKCNLNIV